MQVILDSTAFCRDFWMTGTSFGLLDELLQRNDAKLHLPQVVLSEVPVIYSELLRKETGKIRSVAARVLNNALRIPHTESEFAAQESSYRSYFETWIAQRPVAIIPITNISHQQIVERELQGRKPFSRSDNKKRGSYRDYLIWNAVLDTARTSDGPVVFISENTSDFADLADLEDDKRATLHGDLVGDLRSIGIDAGRVSYFMTLDDFVKEVVVPRLKSVVTSDGSRYVLGVNVERWVRDTIRTLNVDVTDILRHFSFRHLDDKFAASIKNVGGVQAIEVKQMDSGQLLCEVNVECTLEIEVGQGEDIGSEQREAIVTMLLTIAPIDESVLSYTWKVQPRHRNSVPY